MSTEAVLETLRQLWSLLKRNDLSAAVAGGLALAAWRHPRTTHDVDVLIVADRAALQALTATLEQAGFRRPASATTDLGQTELVQFAYEPPDAFVDVQVDLLLAKSDYTREAVARSVALPAEVLGFEVQVLGCEDLIVFKLLSGRVIDRADAVALLRANSDVIDQELLRGLASQAGAAPVLEEIRREAAQ